MQNDRKSENGGPSNWNWQVALVFFFVLTKRSSRSLGTRIIPDLRARLFTGLSSFPHVDKGKRFRSGTISSPDACVLLYPTAVGSGKEIVPGKKRVAIPLGRVS